MRVDHFRLQFCGTDKTILVISATLIYNLIFVAIYLSKYKRYFCHIWFLSIHDTGSIAAAI